MSTRYTGPGVTVEVIENKRIISIDEDVRIPAIVGMGPNYIYVTDEAVTRGSSTSDTLANTSTVTVSKIAKYPGIAATSPAALTDIAATPTDYTADANGVITWASSFVTAGQTYYVTYKYAVGSEQLEPQLFTDGNDIANYYGEEDNAFNVDGSETHCGNLTIAGRIALENGVPAVYLCQVSSGTTFSTANYTTAIDKLSKLQNVGKVIAVFPYNTVTYTQVNTVHAYLLSHVERNSTIDAKKEREAIIGDPYTDFTIDGTGHNTIGYVDAGYSCFVDKANDYSTKRVMYLAPTRFSRVNPSGSTMTLDGNYLACAVAGTILSQGKASTPVTGKVIVGGTIPNELWSETEMDFLGAYGVTVITSRSSIMRIRHALTTDTTSAETVEDSVVQQENLVKRTLRTSLGNSFLGKGYVIDDNTLNAVAATTKAILQKLVTDGEIRAFGQTDNPVTGEVAVTAAQDSTEPRRINVACSYAPLYPLVWIKVTASTYVS
jgi:hypothetical protein